MPYQLCCQPSLGGVHAGAGFCIDRRGDHSHQPGKFAGVENCVFPLSAGYHIKRYLYWQMDTTNAMTQASWHFSVSKKCMSFRGSEATAGIRSSRINSFSQAPVKIGTFWRRDCKPVCALACNDISFSQLRPGRIPARSVYPFNLQFCKYPRPER